MYKAILSVLGVLLSVKCIFVSVEAFAERGDELFAILAVIFSFISLICAGWGIDGTIVADFLSNFFSEKGGEK